MNMLVHEEAPTDDSSVRVEEAVRADKFVIEGNVIKGVHLIGFAAKNTVKPSKTPYSYSEKALREAVPLYDNVDVYTNHGVGTNARDVEDKIGYVTNPSFKDNVGVVGDIVLNPKHTAYEAVLWWAEHKPSKLAMSHVAHTQYDAKENVMVKVAKVHSVDLVSDGSTTHAGLFKEGVLADTITSEKWLDIVLHTAFDAIYEVRYPVGKPLTQAEKAVKIAPIVKDLLDEVSKMVTTTTKESTPITKSKENTMEFADITLDTLRKNRKDIVDAIAAEAVTTHIETEEAVADAIKVIPEDGRSETFKRLVREAVVKGDDKAVEELVADRKSMLDKTTTVAAVESVPAAHARVKTKTTEVKADAKSVAAIVKRK